MINRIKISYFNKLVIFSLVLLIIKLLILPYVHEIDADAISRVYLSLQFADNPHIINAGNWPPIFFYIMGLALKVYNNQFFTPVFVNILFSVFLLFPLFYSLRRLFDNKISFLLCVFFSFSPIVFRMSMLAMSEIPYLFFIILSISILLKGLFEKNILMVVFSGLIMGIAGGIRYESWLLGVLVVLYITYYKSFREALFFFLPFIIIPSMWIVSNYINTNDALNSFNWAIDLSSDRDINSIDSFFRRIWWYPLSLMFAFGPIAFYFFVKEIINFKSNRVSFLLFVALLVFLFIWLVNSLRGSLLLQHRFSITLFLLSFSFLGFYFKRNQRHLYLKTIIFSLSAFLFAFGYSSKGARPIPRLLTEDAQKVSNIINENLNDNAGFICDFWNWETTYYLPFSTNLAREQIEIIDNKKSINIKIEAFTKRFNNGVMLVNKKNATYNLLIKQGLNYKYETNCLKLKLETIFENKSIICFKYTTIANRVDD